MNSPSARRMNPRRTNHSVDRALEVLRLVAEEPHRLHFADIQRRAAVPKATLHALLASLTTAAFLDRSADGAYAIGLSAFEVGAALHRHTSFRDVVGPALDKLLARFNETIHFGALSGGDVVYIDRRDCTQEVRYAAPLGDRKPAYSTGLGKAMLAALAQSEIERRYPERLATVTDSTVRSRDALVHQLGVIRERGYATDDEESTPGVRCIGVAVPTHDTVYGLSITVPAQRATLEQLADFFPTLSEVAEDMRSKLSALEWLNDRTEDRH